MRLPARSRQLGVTVDITPLIDVIFLLIIFFLAASHFVRNESRDEVALPEAVTGEDEQKTSNSRLIVTVTADGQYKIGGEFLSLKEIEPLLFDGMAKDGEKFEVRIRGDKTVLFRSIEPLMVECARAGVTQIKFGALPGGSTP
ncbi:MAG: biopolymer transporter ExbD [Planctomycetaceae bacterium]|jgi:biopolymer transport protein ExbD|nr:biopolymer transporter ExbD [Planctomycetaceae bacterium]